MPSNIINSDVPGPIARDLPPSNYRALIETVGASYYVAGIYRGFDAGINYAYVKLLEDAEAMGKKACEPEEISLEVAKERVKSYFEANHGQALDYGDLRDALCIPLPTIVSACEELEQEGKIAGVD